MILASSTNGVIGNQGGLLWRQRRDMRRFLHITKNRPLIMGRKTWESLPKQLVSPCMVVLTNQPKYPAQHPKWKDHDGKDVYTTHDQDDALYRAYGRPYVDAWRAYQKMEEATNPNPEVVEWFRNCPVVIGGAEIYKMFETIARRVYLTHIHADVQGDTKFQLSEPDKWSVESSTTHRKSDSDDFDFTFKVLRNRAC